MEIREEYLDTKLLCPLTNQVLTLRFVDPRLYGIYCKNGYGFMFKEDVVVKTIIDKDVE